MALAGLLHFSASSFSVGERSWLTSCFSATAPSIVSAAREEAREVTREPPARPSPARGEGEGALYASLAPPRLASLPPEGEDEPAPPEVPRITTRLSVRERVKPFDRYLFA